MYVRKATVAHDAPEPRAHDRERYQAGSALECESICPRDGSSRAGKPSGPGCGQLDACPREVRDATGREIYRALFGLLRPAVRHDGCRRQAGGDGFGFNPKFA